jgi:hypothetical protein
MFEKCALISFILIFMFLYLYVKNESFYGSGSANNAQISYQLTNEIARVLSISQNRITNLAYNGDIAQGKLNVVFNIEDPNTLSSEQSSTNCAILANELMSNGSFKVTINGNLVVLSKIPNNEKPGSMYFDNLGLQRISNYALNKYNSLPNDESLTKFYKLEFDNNYNVIPKL